MVGTRTTGSQTIGHCETNRPLAVASSAHVAWPRQMDAKRCDSYQRCNDQHGVSTNSGSSDASTATMCSDTTVPLPPRPSSPVRRPHRQASARSDLQSPHHIVGIYMTSVREHFARRKTMLRHCEWSIGGMVDCEQTAYSGLARGDVSEKSRIRSWLAG